MVSKNLIYLKLEYTALHSQQMGIAAIIVWPAITYNGPSAKWCKT